MEKKKKGGKILLRFFLVILVLFILICGAFYLIVDKMFVNGYSLNGEWKTGKVSAIINVENKTFSLKNGDINYDGTITVLKFDKKEFLKETKEHYVATVKSGSDTFQCVMDLDTSGDAMKVSLTSDRWGGTTYTLDQINDTVSTN